MTRGGQITNLRKENEELTMELKQAKESLKQLSEDVSRNNQSREQDGACSVMRETEKSVEFLSDQYDQLNAFRNKAEKKLKEISEWLDNITYRCQAISDAIDDIVDYSYQYNMKIVGVPEASEKESAETTANLCLKLFHTLGVKDISMQDIDIAHRVLSRRDTNRPKARDTNRPKAIICKFVRRMAKEKVMSARNEVKKIQPSQLGLQTELISRLGLYDHLSPRLQTLFYEAKKYKIANEYKFCWTKNGAVFLRESDTSHIKRLNKLQDLITLQE